MASAQASNRLTSTMKVAMYDHDPNATTAADVKWVDMSGYERLMVMAMSSTLTGAGATAFTILANSASDGSGTDVEIKAHAVGSAPDAVGDWLVLECSAEELASASTTASGRLRYVSASLSLANAADEAVVAYILAEPRFATSGLTADYVS